MRRNSIAANPILIGAATVLVVLVAVFLSYNANKGLPFVPTYEIKAQVPNAANLVAGNEVRIGANRVGTISAIHVVREPDGGDFAELTLKIEDRLRPLPVDTTSLVRYKSALGLKYLQLTRGSSSKGIPQNGTIPLKQAQTPVEFQEAFSWADGRTRHAMQEQLVGLGNALAGRGDDLNQAIAGFAPLLEKVEPVARNLVDPKTRLSQLISGLARFTGELAPVARQQAQLFVGLDQTFSALASVARPYLQETIAGQPELEQTLIDELPQQRTFMHDATRLFATLRPGTRAFAQGGAPLADAIEVSGPALRQSIVLSRRMRPLLTEISQTNSDPLVKLGVRDLRLTGSILNPLLAFLTPAQTVCNYGSILTRNAASLLSVGDKLGTSQRFQLIVPPQGPNNETGPASAPANGPNPDNFLHRNPYPNTAAPGQTLECEAGNEPFTPGRQQIGNVPGNQGVKTEKTTRKTGIGD